MGDKQKYTNIPFIEYGELSTGNISNQIYSILSPSIYDRRIYGIGITCNDGSTHTHLRFYINNGISNFQMNLNSITANSGYSITQGMYDLFAEDTISSYFSKKYDEVGVPYFNLPAGWGFSASSFLTLGTNESIGFWFTGETYNSNQIIFTGNIFSTNTSFSNSDGTSTKSILSSSAYHRRIYSISTFSSDSTARTLSLKLNNGSVSRTIGTINIPANSGNTITISSLDIISHSNVSGIFRKQKDLSDQPFFHLPQGWSIEGNFAVSITNLTNIKFTLMGGIYE